MATVVELSEAALDLLKRNMSGPQILVDDKNREAYRELGRAGLMIPLHTFSRGDEGAYRLTEAGEALAALWLGNDRNGTTPLVWVDMLRQTTARWKTESKPCDSSNQVPSLRETRPAAYVPLQPSRMATRIARVRSLIGLSVFGARWRALAWLPDSASVNSWMMMASIRSFRRLFAQSLAALVR